MEKLKKLIADLELIIESEKELAAHERETLELYRNTCQEFIDKEVSPREDFIFLVSSAVLLFDNRSTKKG